MAITNHERVGKTMDLLKQGLGPFVQREFTNVYKEKAGIEAIGFLGEDRLLAKKAITDWDTAGLLKLMWEAWNDVFRRTLGPADRSLVSELRDLRNKWAPFRKSCTAIWMRFLSDLPVGFGSAR